MMFSMQHKLKIIPIPAFKDNYIWLIHDGEQAIIVDPGDATPVFSILENLNLNLQTIFVTHHHHDHIDGVTDLLEKYPNAQVYAPSLDKYAFKHYPINEPNTIYLEHFKLHFKIIAVPGHTLGHIAYYAEYTDSQNNLENILFCGDTLFAAGCGRIFEGTYKQLYDSLQKLAKLPAETKVYCTHEYTQNNIEFALSIEPNNQTLIERYHETKHNRALDIPSLPSTIRLERNTNPFLRCYSEEIKNLINQKNAEDLEVFRTIRELKNNY